MLRSSAIVVLLLSSMMDVMITAAAAKALAAGYLVAMMAPNVTQPNQYYPYYIDPITGDSKQLNVNNTHACHIVYGSIMRLLLLLHDIDTSVECEHDRDDERWYI